MFSPDTLVGELPVLPRFHDGRTERLCVVRTNQDRRRVLRLWSTEVKIEGNDTSLFVGTIEEQQSRGLAGLITMARDNGDYERPPAMMEHLLADRFAMKAVRRADYENQPDNEHQWLYWRGGTLLVWSKIGR